MRKNPRAAPFEGAVTIGQFSGLRKLMRAARRGKIPDERMVKIEAAEEKQRRHAVSTTPLNTALEPVRVTPDTTRAGSPQVYGVLVE